MRFILAVGLSLAATAAAGQEAYLEGGNLPGLAVAPVLGQTIVVPAAKPGGSRLVASSQPAAPLQLRRHRAYPERSASIVKLGKPAKVAEVRTQAPESTHPDTTKSEDLAKSADYYRGLAETVIKLRADEALGIKLASDLKIAEANAQASRVSASTAFWVVGGTFLLFVLFAVILLSLLSKTLLNLQSKAPYLTTSKTGDPQYGDIPLTRLPLGLPDGSIRAVISLFIVIVGLLILAFQKSLGLQNAEAISGFVGAIISFYFATRNEAAASDSAAAANKALSTASQAMKTADGAAGAADQARQQLQQTQLDVARNQMPGTQPNAGSSIAIVPASLTLQSVTSDLHQLRQFVTALGTIPNGTGPAEGAGDVVARIDQVLAAAKPLIDAGIQGSAVDLVVAQATAVLKDVGGTNPVVSTIVDALASVEKATVDNSVVKQFLGTVGGPVGLVSGLIFGGLQLYQQQAQFDKYKKAVLAQPFDIDALSADRADPISADVAAGLCPLAAVASQSPANIAELHRISLASPGQAPQSAAAVAEVQASNNTALYQAFGSRTVMTDAITEYRTVLISLSSAADLPEVVAAGPSDSRATVSTVSLVQAVSAVRQEPGASGALDQLLYAIEAIGKVAAGKDFGSAMANALKVAQDFLVIGNPEVEAANRKADPTEAEPQ